MEERFLLPSPAARFTRFFSSSSSSFYLADTLAGRACIIENVSLRPERAESMSGAEGDLVPTERESGSDRKMGQIGARVGEEEGGMGGRTDERTECLF